MGVITLSGELTDGEERWHLRNLRRLKALKWNARRSMRSFVSRAWASFSSLTARKPTASRSRSATTAKIVSTSYSYVSASKVRRSSSTSRPGTRVSLSTTLPRSTSGRASLFLDRSIRFPRPNGTNSKWLSRTTRGTRSSSRRLSRCRTVSAGSYGSTRSPASKAKGSTL